MTVRRILLFAFLVFLLKGHGQMLSGLDKADLIFLHSMIIISLKKKKKIVVWKKQYKWVAGKILTFFYPVIVVG